VDQGETKMALSKPRTLAQIFSNFDFLRKLKRTQFNPISISKLLAVDL